MTIVRLKTGRPIAPAHTATPSSNKPDKASPRHETNTNLIRLPRAKRGEHQPYVVGDARVALKALIEKLGFDETFPPEVMAEVRQIQKNPAIDDPRLKDLTHFPFITIDNDDSKDLDQAMFIRRRPHGGFELFYAIADTSYYVRPDTALWKEMLKRSVTHYFPTGSIPMLPRELSTGLASLNEGEDRRALVCRIELGANGEIEKAETVRARVRSRKQLTYKGVQAFHDNPSTSPLANQPYSETLNLLKDVGEARIGLRDEHGVSDPQRLETLVDFDPNDPSRLAILGAARNDVEKWNEQISLLSNAFGGDLLKANFKKGLPGLFKVHPAPSPAKVDALRDVIDGLVRALNLPADWRWKRDEREADYLRRIYSLNEPGLAEVIAKQVISLPGGAIFSTEPGLHYGTGENPYARITAPSREAIGVASHHLVINPKSLSPEQAEELVQVAKMGQARQREFERAVFKIALDQAFAADLDLEQTDRPLRNATIMDVSPSKVYLRLENPPAEVKMYVADLPGHFEPANQGASLKCEERGEILTKGEQLKVRIDRYDLERGRWVLLPA
jgi:ribonuclease R